MHTVNELHSRLKGDTWRKSHPFSSDLREANELLHNSSAFEDESADCLFGWCRTHQPCQFGMIAAKERRIHFCLLNHEAVAHWPDEDISAHIAADQRLWKQRAAFDIDRATHSFILVVACPIVALAAPDDNLKAFSESILKLSGWSLGRRRFARPINEVSSGYLYLRNPDDTGLYGFQFNIDFFACAGHDRWWHDHRFPGGIAFTANSLGHMRAYREWYGTLKGNGVEWAVKQAMLTIDNAAKQKVVAREESQQQDADGRVTWLRPLSAEGKPHVHGITCPLTNVPGRLADKDWTKYDGYLHTDHAIREEFFQDRETPPTVERPYIMDLTYIYAEGQDDFAEFSGGKPFAEEQVYGEIGRPEEWTHRHVTASAKSRTDEQAALVAQQLAACQAWQPIIPDHDLDG
ncbi:MAG TPA: hypothetical protein PK867_01495 [Pirellulales bacterium]|nr:hypothetical protein [Pirellulales bacterium]